MIHRIIKNFHENKLSEKCAIRIDIYANCGQGIHGKMDPIIAIMHNMIHNIYRNVLIFFVY